jgi:hypothetical protein
LNRTRRQGPATCGHRPHGGVPAGVMGLEVDPPAARASVSLAHFQPLGSTGVVLPWFLRARAGNYGREAGTDARKVADSQQVVRKVCLGKRTLDQESPGSSPGGATRRPDPTSLGRALSFLRAATGSPAHGRSMAHPLGRRRHHVQHRGLVGVLVARQPRRDILPAASRGHALSGRSFRSAAHFRR